VLDFLGYHEVGAGDVEGFTAGSAPAVEDPVSTRPELDHDSSRGRVQFVGFATVGAEPRTAFAMCNGVVRRTTR
jgi:hypothetical protein